MNSAQTSAIQKLLGPGEELQNAENVFCIEWYPNPHKRGVDFYPIVNHVWIALTNYSMRTGYFDRTDAQLSRSDRFKWNGLVPRYLTKPVALGSFVMESWFLPFSDISDVFSDELNLTSVIVNDHESYCWHQVPWQFGESIGTIGIKDIKLYRLTLHIQGNETMYFSRSTDLKPLAEELARHCS
jgi:hypothetical protein